MIGPEPGDEIVALGREDRINTLGPINLLALKEYEEENERYTFLASQRDDLLEAKESLQRVSTPPAPIPKDSPPPWARATSCWSSTRSNGSCTPPGSPKR